MSVPPADRDVTTPARRLGRWAVHPVLLAAYPTLGLWTANVGEVLPPEVWPVLWQPVAIAAAAWLVAAVVSRNHRQAALLVSAGALLLLNLGRVAPDASQRFAVNTVLIVLIVVGAVAFNLRGGALTATTAVVNVLAVVLVLLTLPRAATAVFGGERPEVPDVVGEIGEAERDIWYIVPDRYPRADTLTTIFDYDNSDFLDGLEARGFQVADEARANYPKTAHSLVATWNFEYVQSLVTGAPAGDDWQPLYSRLRNHRLGQALTAAGYQYVHLGTWWSPTATAESADIVRRADTDSEFLQVWRSQTALPSLLGRGEDDGAEQTLRERNRRYSEFQFDELDRLAGQDPRQPRFVLAHITVPHEPYVFDADGSYVTREQAAGRTREENITNQITYLNTRLEELIDRLLAGPEDEHPIIVIQSDEGPHPAGLRDPTWPEVTTAQRAEKLRTLSAIYLPGTDVRLPEDLTGVNTWRLILDTYLGTDLGTVEDRVYVFTNESNMYSFHDVTNEFR